jgi:adenylate cyclase
VRAVEEEHRGMINKYLGDGFMAIFGAGDSGSNHARDAVSAGCEILRAAKGLKASALMPRFDFVINALFETSGLR